MSERVIRVTHGFLMGFTLIFAVITLGISAYIVAKYNDAEDGAVEYPHHQHAYRDRSRIVLTAAVWTTFWGIILTVGFQVAGHSALFGILPHLVPITIGFVLFIIGVASLTGLTTNISCANHDQTFERCRMMKSLVAVGWIDTVFLFCMFIFVLVLAFKARAWGGVRRNTLYIE